MALCDESVTKSGYPLFREYTASLSLSLKSTMRPVCRNQFPLQEMKDIGSHSCEVLFIGTAQSSDWVL
jgi:hypothetical protein